MKIPSRIDRILIVRLSAIGDVVNTLPALTALRRHFPEARIGWVVEDKARGLLEGHPMLQAVHVFERRRWQGGIRRSGEVRPTTREATGLARELRQCRYDLAIDFQGNLKSGVFTRLSGARARIGFGRGHCREGNFLFTNVHVTPPEDAAHRVARHLSLLAPLGVKTTEIAPSLPSSKRDRDRIDALLGDLGTGERKVAVIHGGTSAFGTFKRWPGARYGEVAGRLEGRGDVRAVLTCGPGEEALVGAIKKSAGGVPAALPPLSLPELTALFARASLFIGGDTGPLHMACAAGIPTVALYGPKDPRVYGPYFGRSIVIRHDLHCSPCTKRSCDDPICMTSITAEEVLEAAESLLDSEAVG